MSRAGLIALTLAATSVAVALVALIANVGPALRANATGPGSPAISVAPPLANLWLCNTGAPACTNKAGGVEEVNLLVELGSAVTSPDPKCLATATAAAAATATSTPTRTPTRTPTPAPTATPCPTQGVAVFQFDVLHDQNVVLLDAEGIGIFGAAGCGTTAGEDVLHVRCPATGKLSAPVAGPGQLAKLHVRATADVYSILVPHEQNGIVADLILQSCRLLDAQNNLIKSSVCGNAAVTVRYLEGDVRADCSVDVFDQQQVAFRWGIQLGHLLYNRRYDLDPHVYADGDIDAQDLQVVFGRHGSTCDDPHPPQPP